MNSIYGLSYALLLWFMRDARMNQCQNLSFLLWKIIFQSQVIWKNRLIKPHFKRIYSQCDVPFITGSKTILLINHKEEPISIYFKININCIKSEACFLLWKLFFARNEEYLSSSLQSHFRIRNLGEPGSNKSTHIAIHKSRYTISKFEELTSTSIKNKPYHFMDFWERMEVKRYDFHGGQLQCSLQIDSACLSHLNSFRQKIWEPKWCV